MPEAEKKKKTEDAKKDVEAAKKNVAAMKENLDKAIDIKSDLDIPMVSARDNLKKTIRTLNDTFS